METIKIWWEGPFTKEEVEKGNISTENYDNTAEKLGLYQIYASHPLYGADVLVYIGLTVGKNGFQGRLKNRWVIEGGSDTENVKIYLGQIYSHSKSISKSDEKNQIEKAEALLINVLKPAYNSSYIQSVGKKYIDMNFQIHNMNNYRSLYPILSSGYFWHDNALNFSIIDKLAIESFANELEDEDTYYGFSLKENDDVWFGVDYDNWNKTKVPLGIAVSMKYKKEIKKSYSDFESFNDDEEYYYIPIKEDLEDEDIIAKIKGHIDNVLAILQ